RLVARLLPRRPLRLADAEQRKDAALAVVVGDVDQFDLGAVEVVRVIPQADGEAVLRPAHVVHGAQRAAVEAALLVDLEVSAGEYDRLHVHAAGTDEAERHAVDPRRSDANAADGKAL